MKLFLIEINKEEITDLNPFKSKNDFEKLQRYYEQDEMSSKQDVPSPAKSIIKKESSTKDILPQIVKKSSSPEKLINKKSLIIKEPDTIPEVEKEFIKFELNYEMFKSIKDKQPKTSIYAVTNEKRKQENLEKSEKKVNTEIAEIEEQSIDEIAKVIVSNVISDSKSRLKASSRRDSEKILEGPANRVNSSRNSTRNKSATGRSSSQASYYKNYQTDLFEEDTDIDIEDCDKNDNNLKIELEDESDDNETTDKLTFRQERIEEFKSFLKENNAYVFYKFWVDIQKLEFLDEQHEKLK